MLRRREQMYINEVDIRARYQETDAMAVVHHSVYLVWFEVGRSAFMRDIGYPYTQLEDEGYMIPLTESQCKYKQAVKYDQLVTVRTSLKEMKSATLTLYYEVVNKETQEVLTKGTTTHAVVNSDFKPIRIKKELPKLYDIMSATKKAK